MQKRNRKSIRLKGYDYSQPGHYFITICTHHRAHLFGDVRDGQMVLSAMGAVADACWRAVPEHYPNVRVDAYVIMPNHVHGVLEIMDVGAQDFVNVGAQDFVPPRSDGKTHKFGKIIPRSVATIVRGFKTGVTKWARENTDVHVAWQRNYYEHIVRDDEALNRIRQYIRNNPARWPQDDLNTAGVRAIISMPS